MVDYIFSFLKYLEEQSNFAKEKVPLCVCVCVCVCTDAHESTHVWRYNLNDQIGSAEIGVGERAVDVERILEFQSFDFLLYLYNKKFGKTPGL